ncbi:hypothetical protein [Hymenobacter sp. BT559]|uniref:hypothetical protein n=1 Tax=Hymenobacter sp. BT559 TaxID=2795729 RepID=UPI0018EBF25F|nr:hypothetical protein [Hymenobacter sp. BT559]MBJ6142678.1 hypothetical protein [Hymenobacter sp. BT559]
MRSKLLLGLLLWGPCALAQPDSPLTRLLAERRVLTQRYAEASAQRHSLFGLNNKPSKKDLQEVVDALQGIVNKDEEIVAVLNQTAQQAQTTATTLQNTGRDDRNLTAQRISEFQNDLLNAQQREKQAAERQRALAADLAETQQGQRGRDALIMGLALACVGLFFWRRRR